MVRLTDASSAFESSRLTDALGVARFEVVEGTFRVEAEMIGYLTGVRDGVEVVRGGGREVQVPLSIRALAIRGLDVAADERCRLRPEAGLQMAEVWDEIRKALEAARWTEDRGVYQYRVEKRLRDVTWRAGPSRPEEREVARGYSRSPFKSLPAESLASDGYVQPSSDGGGAMYYAPDAEVLLSDAFLDTHCMRLVVGTGAREGWIGLTFEPVRDRPVPDIGGTLWVDPGSWELRHLEYGYENLRSEVPVRETGGDVRFRRLPDGTWIVPEWTVRMPLLGRGRDLRGRPRLYQIGVRVESGRLLRLQRAGGEVVLTAGSGTIEGVVTDSLGRSPVEAAVVEVVGSGLTATSDSVGAFTLAGLEPDRYRVTFAHPSLTAFEYRPVPIEVFVDAGEVSRVTFRMPSRAELIAAACAAERGSGQERDVGWVTGRILDASTGLPLPGGIVRLAWEGAEPIEVVANDQGHYRACEVPISTSVQMSPSWASFVGSGGSVRVPGEHRSVVHDLTLSVRGSTSLTGIVREGSTGIPVGGARVALETEGEARHETVTDDFGRFLMEGVPAGANRIGVQHAAYQGGSVPLDTRPGERVDLAIDLVRIPSELRRLLPGFSARVSGVTVSVSSRHLPPPPPRR